MRMELITSEGNEGGKADTVAFYLAREHGQAKKVTITFNGHITEAECRRTPEYVPYLWELGPEERAERLAALRMRLA